MAKRMYTQALWRHWRLLLRGRISARRERSNVLDGAYYSALLVKGIRLIVLNTNHCHKHNLWLLLHGTRVDEQLRWLVARLGEAETLGERVHIVGHMTPTSIECAPIWRYNFARIAERFRRTIAGGHFGHEHRDMSTLMVRRGGQDEVDEPLAVFYSAPSFSSYVARRPAFRILDLARSDGVSESRWH